MSRGRNTLYIATSLDEFIATEEGSVSWLDEFDGETDDESDTGGHEEFFAGIDCLIMGARTYEQVLAFGDWPYEQKPTHV